MADEQEIPADASAMAEPEIEANEISEDESERAHDESAGAEGDVVEMGCPVEMGYPAQRCGRKLHVVLGGVDEMPVCLMHSKDPHKQSGPPFDAFWLEFERILAEAGGGKAHFEHFVFPKLVLSKREFHAICQFGFAIFTRTVDFNGATFTQEAEFGNATFSQNATFRKVTFTQNAYFRKAAFAQNATFRKATFTQRAYFRQVIFSQDANFYSVTFTQGADFKEATFSQKADFRLATFSQAASFIDTEFQRTAYWMGSRFLDQVTFRRTKFLPRVKEEPSAVFALARFSKPGETIFDEVDLSRVLIHNCDVSQVWFTSSVSWAKRDGDRGLAVFDEKHRSTEWSDELDEVVHVQLDYRAVAQIYQQLKKNYDSRQDFWAANEFHFSEMEMKRLAVPTDGRLLWLRRWWHPRLGMVSWYKRASDYGNSYTKPVLWLLRIALLFMLLFPVFGIELKP